MKTCSKCGKEKALEEFSKIAKGIKYSGRCRECLNLYSRERYLRNKDKHSKLTRAYYERNRDVLSAKAHENYLRNRDAILARNQKWRELNLDRERTTAREYRKNNREKRRAYEKANLGKRREEYKCKRDAMQEKARKYYYKNWAERRTYGSQYQTTRLKNDPKFKMVMSCRLRIRMVLKGRHKSGKSLELIGCGHEDLIHHIASQFIDRMSWDNYGVSYEGWHVDHIIPCNSFKDLSQADQQYVCFNWRNLQPMWGMENKKKYVNSCRKSLEKLTVLLDTTPPVDETDAMVVATLRAMAQTLLKATPEAPEAS